MSEKKLTQEELLGKMDGAIAIAKEYWEKMDGMSKEDDVRLALNVLRLEQAYTQLKEIVKEHFSPLNLMKEAEKRGLVLISKDYEGLIEYIIKSGQTTIEALMKQQKPTVSREEIISLGAEIHLEVMNENYCALDVDSAIWAFLQKKGLVEG